MIPPPPRSTLFPYTTLFRSLPDRPQPRDGPLPCRASLAAGGDRKSTRLNSSHSSISYAVFCLKKKIIKRSGWASLISTFEQTPRPSSRTGPRYGRHHLLHLL